MGWFRRMKNDTPAETMALAAPELEPEPVPDDAPEHRGVVFGDDGSISIRVSGADEIKLAIKQIKLKKKEYANLRKEATNAISVQNTVRRQKVAAQGSMVRGGGKLGEFSRGMQRISRDADKRAHAATLAPLEARKATIDNAVLNLDKALIELEGHLLQLNDRA